ncbi:MAG: formate dehydrogenase [Desulfobacterales bacterium]|nr:formate dehydrogenase [Desulfobacterales bacterium]
MAGKTFFIDTTVCTACRGCQSACKQWNQNPVAPTRQQGTYQNPPDLAAGTFKLVRFSEAGMAAGGPPRWYFFPDQCRHCLYPPCKMTADKKAKGAARIDSRTRAIVFDPTVKLTPTDFEAIRQSCPYDIPRYDTRSGGMTKCTMCIDRLGEGLQPACVKTCPTGAMNFGERDELLKLAETRLQAVKINHPGAALINADEVRVIFLVTDDPAKYHRFAAGGNNPKSAVGR